MRRITCCSATTKPLISKIKNQDLNVRLQGNVHTILKMYECKSFYSKLILFEADIKTRIFMFFPLLKSQHEKDNIDENNQIKLN